MLFLTAAAVHSQPLVYLLSSGTPVNPRLSSVIERAAQLELQIAGLTGAFGGQNDPSVTTLPGAVQAARISGSPLVLFIPFQTEGSQLLMKLSFVETKGGMVVGSEAVTLPLDLNLDVGVGASVKHLLEAGPVQTALAAARRNAASGAQAPAAGQGTAAGKGAAAFGHDQGGTLAVAGAAPVAGSAPATPSAAQAAGRVSVAAGEEGATPAPSRPHWGFVVSGQAAPLILVGGGSGYFRYGADISLFAGARLPFRGPELQAGLKLGATELFPVSGLLPGEAYLLLAGPEMRVGNSPSSPVGVAARASGGAAVILVRMSGTSAVAKTVPYVDAGLSGSLRLFGAVKLGLELGYLAAFESEFPIMGFAPAVEVGSSW